MDFESPSSAAVIAICCCWPPSFFWLDPLVLRQIGNFCVRAGLEASSDFYQVGHAHIRRQWIAARLAYFTLNVNSRLLDSVRVSVDQEPVARLKNNIFNRIASESLAQADAEYFEFSVGQVTEYLRISCLRVRCETSGQMYSIGQVNLPSRFVSARRPERPP